MAQPVLEARGISRRFGRVNALSDVALVVERGSAHGLLGPNGAGKTTLLRILLGLVHRDAGDVALLGESRPRDGSAPLPDGVAGFVEAPPFYPYLTGRRNLELLARLDGADAAAARERASAALDLVALTGQTDTLAAGLSAGMRQRLGLAAALLREPRLLLLDEPTSSLDPAGTAHLRRLVHRLAADGTAIVLSSHDMAEVDELCDTLTVINAGRVIFSGSIDAFRRLVPDQLYTLRTSDNRLALELLARHPGVRLDTPDSGVSGAAAPLPTAFDVAASQPTLDAYIVALGRAGVAVRELTPRARSLESVFLELVGRDETLRAQRD